MLMCLRDGRRQSWHCLKQMSDEQIARLTTSEIKELIERLLDEIEIRLMQLQ